MEEDVRLGVVGGDLLIIIIVGIVTMPKVILDEEAKIDIKENLAQEEVILDQVASDLFQDEFCHFTKLCWAINYFYVAFLSSLDSFLSFFFNDMLLK